jgi:hypothetical protein
LEKIEIQREMISSKLSFHSFVKDLKNKKKDYTINYFAGYLSWFSVFFLYIAKKPLESKALN